MNGQGEFYIGLAERAPDGVRARLRRTVVLLLTLSIALRVVLALAQRTIGVSVFEWGQVKSFSASPIHTCSCRVRAWVPDCLPSPATIW